MLYIYRYTENCNFLANKILLLLLKIHNLVYLVPTIGATKGGLREAYIAPSKYI